MMKNVLLVAALLLPIALGGCLKDQGPTGVGTTRPPTESLPKNGGPHPTSSEPGPTTPPAEYWLVMSDCDLLIHTMDTQDQVWMPEYPPGVRSGAVVLGTAWNIAGMDFWSCPQVNQGGEIFADFQLFMFYSIVEPINSTDTEILHPQFLFQSYTNSPSFAENASGRYGLDVELVDSVALSEAPLHPGPGSPADYTLTVPGTGSADYTLRGEKSTANGSPSSGLTGFYFADADGNLRHFRLSFEGKAPGSLGGTVTFGPGSYWGQRSEIDSWEFANLPYANVTAELGFYDGI